MTVVGALLAAVTIPLVFVLPPLYRSTATILIEEQEIPPEFVRSTITSFADERIQVIGQRVITRSTLLPIIEKFDLYPKERRYVSAEEILEKMRRDIGVETVSANITDRRSGTPTSATIAFKLSYISPDPGKAQRVANELVTLYLNENLRARKERAGETSSFLADEAARVGKEIATLEAKLAQFKRENASRLPELLQTNVQLRDRVESELDDTERRIQMLEDRKIYLESQLTVLKDQVPPQSAERTLDPEERLRLLRSQYTSLSSAYSESHPDVVRMRREIAALEKATGAKDQGADLERLEDARNELKRLSERYGPDHPDVVRQKRVVAGLEEARKQAKNTVATKPTNASYVSIAVQVESAVQEIASLRARRAELRTRLAAYNATISATPGVEQVYRDLVRDHSNATAKYQELRAKQMEAQVAVEMENERKAERFSLIEPPQYPEKPAEPNRKKLLAMALIGSLGGGFGVGVIAENLNRSVTSPRALSALLESPLLGVVPRVVNEAERARRKRWIVYGLVGLVLAVLLSLIAVHFLYMPLDTLWYVLMRRLQL